ncbi:hypothetical protein [Bradyrhizobium sp. SZCCHNRI1002]|uniref:hypothetical protein n=1 Tax=Bradyrhizobium sp. SZCCHNRI1002 TaxID=3057274 RepID=UPI0028EF1921|nr:hypothetical protein [Bradyrhizobium sp. SZCCHNRI1002]
MDSRKTVGERLIREAREARGRPNEALERLIVADLATILSAAPASIAQADHVPQDLIQFAKQGGPIVKGT